MELTVLSRLNWCLTAVTPLHFLGYYLSKGALFVDDLMQGKPLLDKVPRYLQKYAYNRSTRPDARVRVQHTSLDTY